MAGLAARGGRTVCSCSRADTTIGHSHTRITCDPHATDSPRCRNFDVGDIKFFFQRHRFGEDCYGTSLNVDFRVAGAGPLTTYVQISRERDP